MLAVLLFATGCWSPTPDAGAAVTIVHTARMEGEIEPCG
jgi:hypothetical protein